MGCYRAEAGGLHICTTAVYMASLSFTPLSLSVLIFSPLCLSSFHHLGPSPSSPLCHAFSSPPSFSPSLSLSPSHSLSPLFSSWATARASRPHLVYVKDKQNWAKTKKGKRKEHKRQCPFETFRNKFQVKCRGVKNGCQSDATHLSEEKYHKDLDLI